MTTTAPVTAVKAFRHGPILRAARPVPVLGRLVVGRVESPDGSESAGMSGTENGLFNHALYGIAKTWTGELVLGVWAGLEPVARALLKAEGSALDVEGPAPAPVDVDPAALEQVADPAVACFAATRPLGLVRYAAARVDKLRLVADVCVAVPHAAVQVIVRTVADADRLYRMLRARGVTPSRVTGKHDEGGGRVVICTLGATGRAGMGRARLVLVVDALHHTWADPLVEEPVPHEIFLDPTPREPGEPHPRNAPAVGLMDRLKDAGPAIIVGFLPIETDPSPFEQARLWQIYGFAELVVPGHGLVGRPVKAAVSRINLGRSIPAGRDALAVKKAVWHDGGRNRLRARLARALRQGDGQVLRRDFPKVASGLTDYMPKAVLVLCDGYDQAKAVRKMLDWPLVSGLDDAAAEAEAAANPGGGVIATALGLAKVCGGLIDVVVRMDLGTGLPPLPPGWLAAPGPSPRPLLVADVDDHGHRLPARWSLLRRRAYLAAGWTPVGMDPDVAAWERFRALVVERGERP